MADVAYKAPYVQMKRKWADPWRTEIDLDANSWDTDLGPAMASASISFKYGRINDGRGRQEDLENILDDRLLWYVRIMKPFTQAEQEQASESSADATVVWQGILTRNNDGQGASDVVTMGGEIGNCRGVEYLLHHSPITRSVVTDTSDSGQAFISQVLPFNIRNTKTGAITGNRSNDTHTGQGGAAAGEAYIFSDDDGDLWSAQDIIDYLLVHFGPDDLGFSRTGSTNLAQYKEAFGSFSTIGQALNELANRTRGHSWHVVVQTLITGAEKPNVVIVPTFKDPVQALGINLVPNADTIDLDGDDVRIDGRIKIGEDANSQFDSIIVEGDQVIIMDTLDFSGGEPEFAKGWSDATETAYEAANDDSRKAARFDHVFTTFLVDTGNITLGPQVNADGTLTSEGNFPAFAEPAQAHLGKKLIRLIPLLKTGDDASGPEEFRKPLVYVKFTKDGGDYYAELDSIKDVVPGGMPNLSFRSVDGQMGIKCRLAVNHYLGLNTFTETVVAEKKAKVDYRNIEATVAWASSQRLRVTVTIERDESAEFHRTKKISVPGAQAWWRAPSVTTGIVDGVRTVEDDAATLRNDNARLSTIAALAKAWYETVRRSVAVSFKGIVSDYSVGQIVTNVVSDNGSTEVNSIISRISVNGLTGITRLQTTFDELNFVTFSGQGNKRGRGIGVPALAFPDMPAIGAAFVGQEPDGLPARASGGNLQVIAERGKPTAGFASGTEITLNPVDKSGNDIPNREDVIVYLSADKASVTKSYTTADILSFVRFEGNDGTADGVLVGAVGVEGIPAGVAVPWAGRYNDIPTGWLFCNGAEVSRTAYAALFLAITTDYGAGDGFTTFAVPDTREKFWKGGLTDEARDNATARGEATHGAGTNDHADHTTDCTMCQGTGEAYFVWPQALGSPHVPEPLEHSETDNIPPHWIGNGIIKT